MKKNKIIKKKNVEISRLKVLLNADEINAGVPTSQTSINKKKVILNTRVNFNNSIGGQIR